MTHIRRATESDLPAVIRLHNQLDPGEPQISNADADRIFARINTYPDYAIYVAESDEAAIVGTFGLLVMDKLAHNGQPSALVEDVVVDESLRGQGIGRAMMLFAMEYCRTRGCYKLALSSNLKRTEAHTFYETLGFRKHGFSYAIDLG
jgi:GNAT superfamily N-acetyltransferase